jgi:hypothetical protein
MIELETLTSILPTVAPELEAIDDGSSVGFYRFKSGEYEGITYTYANIKFTPQDDTLHISFQYVIMEDPLDKAPKSSDGDEAFKQTIGDLLVKIIDASVNAEGYDEADQE